MDVDAGTIRGGTDGYVPITNTGINSHHETIERQRQNTIRFLSMLLYGLLIINFIILIGISTYFIMEKCNECELRNRILALAILLKAFIHSGLNVLKLKKHEQIKNNETLRALVKYATRFFRLLSLGLTTISFYHLHNNKYNCTTQTFAVKIIKYYYFAMITIYFFPIFLYLFFGFFISILVYIMVNISVRRSDRVPTPRNILSKLEKKKFKDLDINKNKKSEEIKIAAIRKLKTPNLNMFYEQMKKAMEEKTNPKDKINKKRETFLAKYIYNENDNNENDNNENVNNENDNNENVCNNISLEKGEIVLHKKIIEGKGKMNDLTIDFLKKSELEKLEKTRKQSSKNILSFGKITINNKNNNNVEEEIKINKNSANANNNKIYIDNENDKLVSCDITNKTMKSNDEEETCIFHEDVNGVFDEQKEKEKEIEEDSDYTCTICLLNYTANEDVLIMPCDKRHFFHVHCVGKWLNKSQVCPICRQNIVNYFNNNEDVV